MEIPRIGSFSLFVEDTQTGERHFCGWLDTSGDQSPVIECIPSSEP